MIFIDRWIYVTVEFGVDSLREWKGIKRLEILNVEVVNLCDP